MVKRWSFALLALVALVATVTLGSRDRGQALGPVIAITPDEVIPAGGVSFVNFPDLSDRGEAAGVHDAEFRTEAFVHFDDGDQEPMQPGDAIAVSGDGCSAVAAIRRQSPSPIAVIINYDFVLTNRCTGSTRTVLTVGQAAFGGGSNRLALSQDARYMAVELRLTDTPIIARIDTVNASGNLAMPTPPLGQPTADYGLDISDNGNVIVVTATNFKQTEVVAWTVGAGTVDFVSGPPTGGWSAYPSVSGDGRWASFASSRRRTGGEQGNGPWVYVTDRTSGATRLASDPGVAAYETSVSDDGTQVAYSALAGGCTYNTEFLDDLEFDCIPSQINVSFGSTPGFAGAYSNEIISIEANGVSLGPHFNPVLSGNGRWIAWTSLAGQSLMGSTDSRYAGRQAFLRRRDSSLAVGNVNFGSVLTTGSATGTSNVVNSGRSTVTIATITPSPGAYVVTGGTCGPGVSLPPGASCSVNLRFNASGGPATVNGTLTVAETGYDAISGQGSLTGTVTTTTTPPTTTTGSTTTTSVAGGGPIVTVPPRTTTTTLPGTIVLSATPDPVDFGDTAILIPTEIRTVTVNNTGTADAFLVALVTGDHKGDFALVGGSCTIGPARAGESCTLDYRMTATQSGVRTAELVITASGSSTTVGLTGVGRFEPRLVVTPQAVTERGIATIVGQGFPPAEDVEVRVDDGSISFTATPDDTGSFRIPLSPLGRLQLGNHGIAVDDVPSLYVGPTASMVVVLPTFSPQGPTGPAFNNSLLVARG